MPDVVWQLEELPAVTHARELVEGLDREAGRLERALRDEKRERVAEDADAAETQAWMARLRGQALPDVDAVLTRGREDAGLPGDPDRQRRHRAREILRQYGLEDVLTGGASGVVFDANLGVLEPRHDVPQRFVDFEDAETARLVKRYAEDRAYIQSISRSRLPFARRSVATRSESCVHCVDQGVDDETSYLLHSDPELAVPTTSPAEKAEADRRQAELDRRQAAADRLQAEGFTAETARYAAGLAVR